MLTQNRGEVGPKGRDSCAAGHREKEGRGTTEGGGGETNGGEENKRREAEPREGGRARGGERKKETCGCQSVRETCGTTPFQRLKAWSPSILAMRRCASRASRKCFRIAEGGARGEVGDIGTSRSRLAGRRPAERISSRRSSRGQKISCRGRRALALIFGERRSTWLTPFQSTRGRQPCLRRRARRAGSGTTCPSP